MRKILLIGWKDVSLAFRDWTAIILMLAAPFALTLGLGFVTGRFSGAGGTGVSDISVVLVNQDQDQLGNALVDLFQSADLAGLVMPTVMEDPALARQEVDADKAAAAIIIPAGFTRSIIPAQGSSSAQGPVERTLPRPPRVALYANPTQPTSAGVIRTILDEFLSQVEVGRVSGQVVVTQLLSHGLIQAQDAARMGAEIGARQASTAQSNQSITVKGIPRSKSSRWGT